MKKLVLTVVSAVVTVASAYAAAPQALYLPNDIGYGWNYSAPEMARDGNKFSYMLEGKSADNDMFFFVSSKRADDWNGYTANGFNGLYGVSGDNGDTTSARYNRQNQKYNFAKRKVHFSDFSAFSGAAV